MLVIMLAMLLAVAVILCLPHRCRLRILKELMQYKVFKVQVQVQASVRYEEEDSRGKVAALRCSHVVPQSCFGASFDRV